MNSDVDTLLIDYDGTLVDSEKVHREIWLSFLKTQGKPQEIKNEDFLGLPASVIAKKLFGSALASAVLEAFESQELQRDYQWMPGAEDFITYQHAKGTKLAIVTNSRLKKVTNFLEKKNMCNTFDVIVSCDDVKNRKPHPEAYELALKRLNARLDNSIAIEDSLTGLCAAKEAGLRCMLVKPQAGYDINTWNNALQETVSISSDKF